MKLAFAATVVLAAAIFGSVAGAGTAAEHQDDEHRAALLRGASASDEEPELAHGRRLGTLPNGYDSYCTSDSECASGNCKLFSPNAPGRYCAPDPLPNGSTCTADWDCTSDYCTNESICARSDPINSFCTKNSVCKSRHCNFSINASWEKLGLGQCKAKIDSGSVPMGGYCYSNDNCESELGRGWCDFDGKRYGVCAKCLKELGYFNDDGVCLAKKSNGGICYSNEQCASGWCRTLCDYDDCGRNGYCDLKKLDGGICYSNEECESGWCNLYPTDSKDGKCATN